MGFEGHITTRRIYLKRLLALGVLGPSLSRGNVSARANEAKTPAFDPPYRNLEELDASLAAAKVSAADRRMLLGLAKPALALSSKAAPDGEVPIGASKIGGTPDLPLGQAWPMRAPSEQGMNEVRVLRDLDRDKPSDYFKREIARKEPLANRPAPLAFMLQLDLAACAALGELDPDIPRDGRLLVFYDFIFKPWNGHQSDGKAVFQLLHDLTPTAELARREPPDLGYPLIEGEEGLRDKLPPARILPTYTLTLPDASSLPIFTRYPYPRRPPHDAWLGQNPNGYRGAANQLGGWPENIQGDMAIELTAADRGIPLPSGSAYMAAVSVIEPLTREWVHLLQIGDYDNTLLDFDGLYHIWIKRTDLRARDFSKARLIYRTT
jgi:hypothetical protein